MWLNNALYGWYPYVALTVFLLGSLLRFDHSQYTWRTGSSQLLRRRQLLWGSNLFHVGILAIFAGHFVGLLTPIAMFEALGVSHTFKQLLAMMVGGVAGSRAGSASRCWRTGACSMRASAPHRASAISPFCCCCGCN